MDRSHGKGRCGFWTPIIDGFCVRARASALFPRGLFTGHIHDLVALAVGATRDAANVAFGRGMRAARLQAAKAFIIRNIRRADLSAKTVAVRLGVTPRYVNMLF